MNFKNLLSATALLVCVASTATAQVNGPWETGGNTFSPIPLNHVFGTQSANGVDFYTTNEKRGFISGTGQIGLGMTTGNPIPAFYIDLQRNVGVGTNDAKARLHVADNGLDASYTIGSGILMLGDANSANLVFDNNEILARKADAGGQVESDLFIQKDGGHIAMGTGLNFFYHSGVQSFGLGTGYDLNLDGSYKLHVAGNTNLRAGQGPGIALAVDGTEALWFGSNGAGDTYFSHGYGATFNYFNTGVNIGFPHAPGTPPSKGLAVNGSVGIGIDNPSIPLHVFDNGSDASLQPGSGVAMIGNEDGHNLLFDNNEILARNKQAASDLFLSREGANTYIGPGSAFVVTGASKFTGLGTATPADRLDVHGRIRASAPSGAQFVTLEHDGFRAHLNVTTNAFTDNTFQIGGNGQLNEVLIGQANQPKEILLRVYGEINSCAVRTNEVEVHGNFDWCDYVFEDDYDLKPLTEVEAYIKEHGHLPNIPPAAEVEANGLNLGDMQIRMMEKIEELTLYVIAQQREIERLSKQNDTTVSGTEAGTH